ncbi:unnamed protein product, partial [Meganyctiphanes norvegica]
MSVTKLAIVLPLDWGEFSLGGYHILPRSGRAHVLAEDTVTREVKDNKLHSKRLIRKTNRMPKWGEYIVRARHVHVLEESVIDPEKQEVCTYTRNVGLNKVLNCVERVTYRPCPENPKATIAERKAWFDSKIFGVSYAIQSFSVDRYRKNISKTDQGFIWALTKLFPSTNTNSSDSSHDNHSNLEDRKQRLKDAARETAKRAKELAKEKAGPIYASCEGVKS